MEGQVVISPKGDRSWARPAGRTIAIRDLEVEFIRVYRRQFCSKFLKNECCRAGPRWRRILPEVTLLPFQVKNTHEE